MGQLSFRAAFAGAFACLLALPAKHAHGQLSPALTRPWAAGVSDSEQAIARELYVAGNREFAELRFAQALAKYKEAIQHWDHPAIRYNMAVCLINLDQLVEARDNLERSLAYGAAPLEGDTYGHGLTSRKLLDAQLAHLKIAARSRARTSRSMASCCSRDPARRSSSCWPGSIRWSRPSSGP
jgi:tetratricopeptide (TPR) repeat protein